MNKARVLKLVNTVKTNTIKHSPEILTGLGIAGMITTTVLAVRATPKALALIDEAQKRKLSSGVDEPLTKPEVIKVAWKPYIPSACMCTASVACLIGASSVNAKRNAALATAYELSRTALTEYKEKVIETVGEKKEAAIREKVAQKKVDEMPANNEVIIAGSGDILFLDPVSMRYFRSDIETVRGIINDLNERMVTGMEGYISLSEFYNEVGLSHTSNSDYVGWNLYRDGQIKVKLPAAKTEKGEPCLMLDYLELPKYNFSKNM